MKKLKYKIENWLQNIVEDAVKEAVKHSDIESRVGKEIEKLRYDYLPHGACWMCSMPVSRRGGYSMWRGRMFCSTPCLDKYAQLIQSPDEKYRILDGDVVEVFSKKEN